MRTYQKTYSFLAVLVGLILALGQLSYAQATISCRELLSQVDRQAFSYYSPGHIFYDLYSGYSPERIHRISKKLTSIHADYDMSFQVKNPKTGVYDKSVAVPVNGMIAPIEKAQFDKLVASTGPVMRALRKLLQNIYSAQTLTPTSMGLQDLTPEEAALFTQIVKESIYLEPKLQAPQMADYPFLAIAGWDGAIGDPHNPKPHFFELNLGTPSGLSNNIQLLSYLQQADPATFKNIQDHLPADNTFQLLRRAIESSALKWTRNPVGISVVVSPGVYNGAHPDVAAIAKLSGMPLVELSDLYMDDSGHIRLNIGNQSEHPVVTGIYGRMEESFFLQSNELDVPMISPSNNNQELAKKLGVPLRKGAIYKYVYNESGEVIDVVRDKNNKPVLENVWAQIGTDPKRPQAPRGEFLKAILDRKLYYSALGGRVVDDKRLFQMISQKMAKTEDTSMTIAGPVPSLKRNEYEKFFATPQQFVVKEPNNSGGVGVYFVGQLNAEEKQNLVQRVRNSPGDFEIQYVSDVTTLPVSLHSSQAYHIDEVATDLRLFVIMDGDGNVGAGPHSLLLRTAPYGSLYSNTSRGGGYGIGVVYQLQKNNDHGAANAPRAQNTSFIAEEKLNQIYHLLRVLKFWYADLKLRGPQDIDLATDLHRDAFEIVHKIRGAMDVLPLSGLLLIEPLRALSSSEKPTPAQLSEITKLLNQFFIEIRDRKENLSPRLHELLSDFERREGGFLSLLPSTPLTELTKTQLFPAPEITYTYRSEEHGFQKLEMGVYTSVDNVEIQKFIDEVHAAGGEVRLLKARHKDEHGQEELTWHPPYFWVNTSMPQLTSYMKPVIAIDLTQDRALAGLTHEMQHFRDWKTAYDLYRSQGMDHNTAATRAQNDSYDAEFYVHAERRALDAEIKSEIDFAEHPFNQGRVRRRPHFFYEYRYVNRMTYPEFEGAKELLRRRKTGQNIDSALLDRYMTELIQKAAEGKEKAILFLNAYLANTESNPKDAHLNRRTAENHLSDWKNSSLLELIIYPYGIERLTGEGIYEDFVATFRSVARDMGHWQKNLVWEDKKTAPRNQDPEDLDEMTSDTLDESAVEDAHTESGQQQTGQQQ